MQCTANTMTTLNTRKSIKMKAEDSAKSDLSVTYTLIFKVKVHDERNDHKTFQLMQQLYSQPLQLDWSVRIYMHKHNNDATEAPHPKFISQMSLSQDNDRPKFLKAITKFSDGIL